MNETNNSKYTAGFYLAVAALAVYALATRLLALSQPYHHDEYKWALAADPAYGMTDSIPHPFFVRSLYETVGSVIGYDQLRLIPTTLSLVLVVVLFFYVRRRFGRAEAFVVAALYIICTFALLGSVQIDIDGVFLPLFALLAFWAYQATLEAKEPRLRTGPLIALGLVIALGLLSKLSFVLVPTTLALHFIGTRSSLTAFVRARKKLLVAGLAILALLLAVLLGFWESVPFLRYVDNFVAFAGRDYAQVVFQTVKAAFYLSPLLVLGLVFAWRHRKDFSIWLFFLGVNIVFYYIIFDFSHRTFDRYLLFLVLPLSVVVGVSLVREYQAVTQRSLTLITVGATAFMALIVAETIAALPQRVLPLIPKSAFVESVLSLRFDFLLPMTGGSGPLGFYLPIGALVLLWGIALIAFFVALFSKRVRVFALSVLVGISLAHTLFVTSEYLTGKHYGFSPDVVRPLVAAAQAAGQPVLTYNDIGAYELHEAGIYAARFYPHTEFVADNLRKLSEHEGLFLVVQIPAINPESVYGQFFSSCVPVAKAHSGKISGELLDCAGVPVPVL